MMMRMMILPVAIAISSGVNDDFFFSFFATITTFIHTTAIPMILVTITMQRKTMILITTIIMNIITKTYNDNSLMDSEVYRCLQFLCLYVYDYDYDVKWSNIYCFSDYYTFLIYISFLMSGIIFLKIYNAIAGFPYNLILNRKLVNGCRAFWNITSVIVFHIFNWLLVLIKKSLMAACVFITNSDLLYV